MTQRASILLNAALATCLCAPVSAAMYRWVDENGVTVYSQTRPPAGEAVRIKPDPAPDPADAEAARQQLKGQLEQSFDAEEEKKQAAEERSRQKEADTLRAENCRAARHNLDMLQNLGRRAVRTPDGRFLRPSEDEVASMKEKARLDIEEYCE